MGMAYFGPKIFTVSGTSKFPLNGIGMTLNSMRIMPSFVMERNEILNL